MKKIILLVTVSLALMFAGVASAGNLPPAGAGTITIDPASTLTLGGYVAFDASWTGHLNNPRAEALCYQDGRLVYGAATGDSGYGNFKGDEFEFPMFGYYSLWSGVNEPGLGGNVDCAANLYYFKVQGTNREWNGSGQQETVYLATVSFAASG